eukprot:scaffold16542_cov152-Skeletonema_dohrnii-CCMP3373.AAC.4
MVLHFTRPRRDTHHTPFTSNLDSLMMLLLPPKNPPCSQRLCPNDWLITSSRMGRAGQAQPGQE